jgi:hypothetical protein
MGSKDGMCTSLFCPEQECTAREGFRLAVGLVRAAVADGEAAEWLPARMCLEATGLVPGWDSTDPEWNPPDDQWLSPEQQELMCHIADNGDG